jgi:multicomponent Na+:H+ antiporter subunit D
MSAFVTTHLAPLQVVLALLAAPVCLLLRRPKAAWAVATGITWILLGIALALLARVLETGTILYALGNWPAPWGIEYRIDLANAFMLVIVTLVGSAVMPYARASIAAEIPEERIYLFYCMYLLNLAGLLGMAITGDVFNLFVFLEISSLSSYVMISLGRDRSALTAAYRYLIMGTIGATFYIIGVGMMYMATGSLNMADLANLIPATAGSRTILVALAFITVGLGLKLALVPLHMWLPNAYAHAPSVVSVFLTGTGTKIAIYALMRILFTVFGGAGVFDDFGLGEILSAFAVIAMIGASAVAIYQTNVKRLLAYSSLAQIGYIMLGISMASVLGMSAGIVHLFNHALIKAGLFMVMGCIYLRTESVKIDDLKGLAKVMPVTMAAFVAGGFGLIGVPLTGGFISKWYLLQAAIEKGWWLAIIAILISSLLAIIYIWRVVEAAYFQDRDENAPAVSEAPWSMLAPMWMLIGVSFYFGIHATLTMDVAIGAAEALLGGIQ